MALPPQSIIALQAVKLTHDELLALAGSARVMVFADGEFSEGEVAIVERMGEELGLDDLRWRAIWKEAREAFAADRSALEAAAAVARPEAQEVIYEQLYVLATDGTIVDAEWDILEWLDETWRARGDG
ncbi:MAG: hypothetical protein CMN30_19245 [Sandaracinus sp.]|nr:hypothetical protein [Sandaracinus sp.]|tara:strand:- start:199 stop:582 length:384 start_codon:yes stop_codon:yes gene_type:complete